MLEFYMAYADYIDLMDLTEEMLRTLAQDILGDTRIPLRQKRAKRARPSISAVAVPAPLHGGLHPSANRCDRPVTIWPPWRRPPSPRVCQSSR